MVQPIMKLYADSTDGSYTEEKESALVWNYSQADPDFGHWQVSVMPLTRLCETTRDLQFWESLNLNWVMSHANHFQ